MKKVLFYLGLLGLSACSTPTYVLTTDIDEHQKSESVGGEYSRTEHGGSTTYTMTIDNSLKQLLVPVQEIEKSGFINLGEFLYLCNKGKFGKAKKILASQNLNDPEVQTYLEGLLLFLQKNHKRSMEVIAPVKSTKLALQYQLLLLDNEYEIQKKKKLNKTYFIQKYQAIIDTYSLDKEYYDFINARIKSLRYS